jgi:hypothetical protein
MAGLLDALFRNESGGRNIANTTQGTSSGQAQGYFQITTGTWNEFGGQQYAPDPLHATYEQQAAVASKIPLKRWDESTVALMRSTGKPIDPNRTLGENLAANGESIAGTPRVSGPVEAAGGGAGSDVGASQLYSPPSVASAFAYLDNNELGQPPAPWVEPRGRSLADDLSSSVSSTGRRTSDGGANGLVYGPEDEAPAQAQAFDFSQPPAENEQPPAPLVTPSSDQPLADLFKVRDIGQAAVTDPRTGVPAIGRRRRAYG